MGVPKFFGQFLHQVGWRNIRQDHFPGKVAICGFDMNSLFHEAAQIAYAYGAGRNSMRFAYVLQASAATLEKDFFDILGQILTNAITSINPTKTVIMAVDGVVPMAKSVQQRSRRFMSAQHTYSGIPSELFNDYSGFLQLSQDRQKRGWQIYLADSGDPEIAQDSQFLDFPALVEKYPQLWENYLNSINYFGKDRNRASLPPLFDTNVISPGTELMYRLDQYLREWITTYTSYALVRTIIYSSYKEPGEGEHKIMNYIRSNVFDDDDIFLIYGLDADLFMLALIAPHKNLFLARGHSVTKGEIVQDISDVFNMDNARRAIVGDLKTKTALDDFVVLTFFIGNDFLPRMPSLEDIYPRRQGRNLPAIGLNALLEVYRQLQLPLTDKGELHWPNLHKFFQYMATYEPQLIEYESRRPIKHPSKIGRQAIIVTETRQGREIIREIAFNFEKYRQLWYLNALAPKGSVIPNLVPGNLYPQANSVSNMVGAYFQGLAWIYRYYTKGMDGINSYWYYPYYNTPLFTEMFIISQTMPDISGYEKVPQQTVFNVVEQLLVILPLPSRYLLPVELNQVVAPGSIINQYFPEDFFIEQDGKDTDYERTPILPFVNPYLLMKVVRMFTDFSPERQRYYQAEGTLVMVRDNSAREKTNYEEGKQLQISRNYRYSKEELEKLRYD